MPFITYKTSRKYQNMIILGSQNAHPKHFHSNVCGRVPWLNQYWPGGFIVFVVLCPGTPEGSTGSGSGFKASQKTGQQLKVSSDRLGEAGNRTCDFHSIYIEMNGILPVKKMNNLTKLNIKLFHICLYHCKDKILNFLVITYKTMATQ